MDTNLLVIIGVMTFAGFFGGLVNYFQTLNEKNAGDKRFWACVVAGLCASYTVPLFLQMISSNLIENSLNNSKHLLVLCGFCIVASIFSRRFIRIIADKILKEVKETKRKSPK